MYQDMLKNFNELVKLENFSTLIFLSDLKLIP